MSMESHLAELERRHQVLKQELQEAQARPSIPESELLSLKRRKLQIKDTIARLRQHRSH
ncbi:hypothetical protein SAMN05216548_10138 [Faunimonas pinastri]|uniref:DUF465 domain-containing protein n=1 Tax=Faunimonas pinastri TaxID=1855383 RepID=A0A1H8Z4I5_9HYPH|nr:DUF465 domain-containing protein [Faunimonas pinastri]SEP59375.1 hypothetical protein SAMN05216548_10138 [Faunimonas pinastri]